MSSMPRCVFMCVYVGVYVKDSFVTSFFRILRICLLLSNYLSFKTVGNSQAGPSDNDQANEGRFRLNVSTVMFV